MESIPNCHSRLWQQANLVTNFFFLSWTSSLGYNDLKRSKQSLMLSIFADLKSFIKKCMTAKSGDITSAIVME